MVAADMDRDGSVDLVLQGAWLKNPGPKNNLKPESWNELVIGSAPSNFKVAVADFDKNGWLDVVFADSEGNSGVTIYFASRLTGGSEWRRSIVISKLEKSPFAAPGRLRQRR
jgi:hypothetical protein